jgi:hypothetical protein
MTFTQTASSMNGDRSFTSSDRQGSISKAFSPCEIDFLYPPRLQDYVSFAALWHPGLKNRADSRLDAF